jgi:hypothetical protein
LSGKLVRVVFDSELDDGKKRWDAGW